ncbi:MULTISPECIES: CPBP family intramembrane glutamic endopeptidase [unclassified Acidovorax]|uniref:CPBP family intramembrane glutamic endopeptidase n=1 Tax=unclassified Acidovorax TaxID=2684926 RepID=UPI001C479F25|nr:MULTISPECIES: CPBP family intramembrane glutamic endopeptidase [unclassified Acidovorax]MBV7460978.1 CPBP family intramembrane metalloprotease [Acidovorax sp. sif0632]MBV7466004.1 CPBP family intramembrane metalloprotease [Acidovorax sp. sif0613]
MPLSTRSSVMLWAASAIAFVLLLAVPRWLPDQWGGALAALLFVGVQWAGLRLAVGPAWRALFRRPRWRDVALGLAAVPLVIGLPALVAAYGLGMSHLSANASIDAVAGLSPAQLAGRFALVAVQLLGEELVTILPLLATVALLHRAGMPARWAVALAWMVTALVFGALHLPTYQWHLGQALLVIGAARLALTAVFIYTRNLWASTIAHIANDWTIMAFVLASTRTIA